MSDNRTKQVYLSFPISGLDITQLLKQVDACCDIIKAEHPDWHLINPIRLCQDIENDDTLTPRQKYAKEMGRDIETILQCDAFVYINDITDIPSAGCYIEASAVKEWNNAHRDTPILEYVFIKGNLYKAW